MGRCSRLNATKTLRIRTRRADLLEVQEDVHKCEERWTHAGSTQIGLELTSAVLPLVSP